MNGPDTLVVLDGSTFFASGPSGDVEGAEAEGFFCADMRHLSRWGLLVDGAPMRVLTSRNLQYYSAAIFGTLASARVGENPAVSIQRERIVADGVHEDIVVGNHSEVERTLRVEFRYGSDFADIFEIKDRSPKRGKRWTELGANELTLWHERDGFRRGTRIRFSEPCEVGEEAARFDLTLQPRSTWSTHIDVSCLLGDEERRPAFPGTWRCSGETASSRRSRPSRSSPTSPRPRWRPSRPSRPRRTTPSGTPSPARSCTSCAGGSWRRSGRSPTPRTTDPTMPRRCS